jgi:hypothetical protein
LQRCCRQAVAALVIAVALPGCGRSGPPRYELSGTVRYAGKPLPAGYIVFAPDRSAGGEGAATQADIHDGQYLVPAERGILGGPYVAAIYGFDGVRSEENGIVNALGNPIVANYRVTIDLPRAASVSDFVVPVTAATP